MLQALDHITISGFRSIRRVHELALRPVNVVIGANGSGKSNLIRAFDFLRLIRMGRLQNTVGSAGGAERLLHFGSKTTPSMHFELSFSGGMNQYRITLAAAAGDTLVPETEAASYWKQQRYLRPVDYLLPGRNGEAGISGDSVQGQHEVVDWVRHRLLGWRVYHFHDTSVSSRMRKSCEVNDNRFLREDGSNLAAFLYLLQEKYPETFGLITATVQDVAPFFKCFRLAPSRLNAEVIKLEWVHRGSDHYFDASSLSDGTLRFIALSTLLLQPSLSPQFPPVPAEEHQASVILVDEPELGLHPYAIAILAALMKRASGERQVIASTQSALLLDHFEPEDVLVATHDGTCTSFTRLEKAPLDAWLEDYSLGQLWEKGQFGGRPNA